MKFTQNLKFKTKIITMKKLIITACIFTGALISQAQASNNKGKNVFADSTSKRNEFHQGSFQLGAGVDFTNFYANSFYLGSNFESFYPQNLGASITARYFITDHTSVKVNLISHGANNGRVADIRNGNQRDYAGLYTDCNFKASMETHINVEHFVQTANKIKPYFGISSFISKKEVSITNNSSTYYETYYGIAPTGWIQSSDSRTAVLFGLGTTGGVNVILFKRVTLNAEVGLLMADIHNQNVSSNSTISSTTSLDGSNTAVIEGAGLNKKNSASFGTQAGAHLYYNF
jgi:hypothetical protein